MHGFTLIELLVVVLIVVTVSVIALPVVAPALSHREVREAARLVQGTLVGARDSAIHNKQPSGIRLLPDPNFVAIANGLVDPSQILACNRIIPIDPAPDYSEGFCTPATQINLDYLYAHLVTTLHLPKPGNWPGATTLAYPVAVPRIPSYYPNPQLTPAATGDILIPGKVLMLLENYVDPRQRPATPNPPTSWHWNIRVGDRLQLNNAGPWYTVVGPMTIPPSGVTMGDGGFYANPEMFVNTGVPGDTRRWPTFGGKSVEFLLLVNGQDDNNPPNGWIDEGWDGVDNNGDGYVDENPSVPSAAIGTEWEVERWLGTIPTQVSVNLPYTIRRRPVPTANAREIPLPTDVVIDLTGWHLPAPERSRIPGPMFNPYTGAVDIVINPDGTVRPTTLYSSPASFGMGSSFLHLWLAERKDLAAPSNPHAAVKGVFAPPHLPLPRGVAPVLFPGQPAPFGGQEIEGESSLITLFTRTGQILLSENPPFLRDANGMYSNDPNADRPTYNPNYPFTQVQQGMSAASQ